MSWHLLSSLFLSFEIAVALSAKKATTIRTDGTSGINASGGGVFMITSGLTSSTELCLTVENGRTDTIGANAVLVPCAAAIAAGDGRELFSMQPNGQFTNVAGHLCLGLNGDVETGVLGLSACDSTGYVFELEGSGQIKFGKDGKYCVSQRGYAAGIRNVAVDAAVSATSSAPSHGPSQAINGAGSYWASKLGVTGPVEFVVDIGSEVTVDEVAITWEFPAKSFSVMVEGAGSWSEIYSTSVNSLYKTHIPMGSSVASKLKIVMIENHPTHGNLNGNALYGIASLDVKANLLNCILEECSTASKSVDCRDKYFLNYVGEFDPFPAKALRGEVPGLEAAQTSLAATTAELASAVSKLDSCTGANSLAAKSSGLKSSRSQGQKLGRSAGLNAGSTMDLLKEARSTIIQMRAALK